MLYGSETLCLKESDMEILQRTEISMVRAMCGVQLKDQEISMDLMFMSGLHETIDHLAMVNSVRWWWSCVEERGWSCHEKDIRFWGWRSKKGMEAEEEEKKRTKERKERSRLRKNLCRLVWESRMHFADRSVVLCWRKSDSSRVEIYLATLTCWGYYQILYIGVYLPLCV